MEANVRNIAILSHSGAGKTSLVEAMLYRSGGKPTLGRVEDGNTASDYTPEEQRRKISIYTSVLPVSWQDCRLNLLDTPGYADFVGEIRGAQNVADAVLVVVSAVSGVAVGTERVWSSSRERNLPSLLVINKMDRENADFYRTMSDIEASLEGNIAALQVPIGQAADFRGVVDVLRMRAYTWQDGQHQEGEIPDEARGLAEEYRERLVESIVETDDELMMQYLEDAPLDDEALREAFHRAVRRGELTPVILTSATEAMGIQRLLDLLVEGVRRPEKHQALPLKDGGELELETHDGFCARVFKTTVDPYLGKVSLFRVWSGSLKPGDTIIDSSQDAELKVSHIYLPKGKDLEEIKEVSTGMIGALTKLTELRTGDTLCDKAHVLELRPMRLPSPVMSLALYPKSRADEDRLGVALQKLLDEDVTLTLERNQDTRETVLSGMGHVHLEVAIDKLRDRYGADVETRQPKIAYRETVQTKGDARYRHKKQTGGAGQFAEVALRVEPLPRGTGFEFGNEVVGGTIPSQFVPSCEKGIRGALGEGALGGFPVVDVKAIIYDGKDHPVDSKDIAFQIAAAQAFKEAMQSASPALLEPVALVKVRVPDRFTGDVISDLNTRRGRILGMDAEGSVSTISAHVPLAEVQNYSADLRSMTGGRGVFSVKLDHYAEVPQHLTQRIVGERKAHAQSSG
jgi:elongation factor G